MMWLQLLTPGVKIKRWIALAIIGIAATSYGVGSLLRWIFFQPAMQPYFGIISAATLQPIPVPYRDFILIGGGLSLVVFSAMALLRALTDPFSVPRSNREWIEQLVQYRQLQRRPSITVIGNGSVLLSALPGLNLITHNLSVVFIPEADKPLTTSSILREARQYLLSLSSSKSAMERILSQHVSSEDGHTLDIGNALLSAAVSVCGDIEAGLKMSCDILAIRGQVFPAYHLDMTQQAICPTTQAARAIMDCDLLILAPSVPEAFNRPLSQYLPLRHAMVLSRGLRICLLPTEAALAAQSYTPQDFIQALGAALEKVTCRFVLADSTSTSRESGMRSLKSPQEIGPFRLITLPLADSSRPEHYDSYGLAEALLGFYQHYERLHRRRWRI